VCDSPDWQAVEGIPDILVRFRNRGSVPLTNPDPTPDPIPFFSDFFHIFFFIPIRRHIISLKNSIFAKILCYKFFASIISVLNSNTFMKKGTGLPTSGCGANSFAERRSANK
jgi:hypothetical protein